MKTKLIRTPVMLLGGLLLIIRIVQTASALPNHPGGYLTEPELELIRSNVTANIQPQASAFAAMINSGPNASWTTGESGNVVNSYDMQNQGNQIWTLTVKWIGSGNTNYAVAAWKGIDQWVNNVTNMTATTTLRTGVGGCQMANAAEILAYGFGGSSGWPAANIAKAKAWFKAVPYKAISGGVASRTGNWGTSALTGCMAMAIFCDDQTMFDYAVNAYKFGFQDTTDGNCGVTQYIDATGEAMESGRDQGHVQGGLAHLAEVALMAWNQGVNIVPYNNSTGTSGVNGSYGVSGTNRLFIGIDSYEAKYNLGGTVSYHPYLTPWGQIYYPNGIAPRGSWSSPVWEMVTHLFAMSRMIPTYSGQVPLVPGYAPEASNGDHVGYGTLLFHNITAVPVAYIGAKYNGTNIGSPNAPGSSTTKDMAFDSSLVTYYSSTNASGDWTGLDFGVGVSNWIGRIRYCPRDNFAASMVGGIFQGANDSAFSSPVTLYTITNAPPTNQMTLQIISLNLTNKFCYVRYLGPANANCNVAEIEFYPPLFAVPPSGLLAVAGNQQVALTWGTNMTANTYILKRSLAGGGPYTNLLSTTATNYTDTGLISGVPYYYVVSSTNSYGESTNSSEVSAIPAGKVNGTVIGTAGSYNNSGNTIAKIFDGNLNTFFDAPNGSIGPWAGLDFGSGVSNTITQIKYCSRNTYASRMVGGMFQGATDPNFTNPVTLFTVTVSPPLAVMSVQTITNTTAFRYVRYLGPANSSCNVAEVEFYGYATLAPAVPTGLIATPDDSQVMLNWSAASGATRYNLKRSTTNGGPYTVIASNLTFLTYTDTGVFNGTNYYYVVSAMNVGVESTNSIQAAAMPNVVPDVPTSLAAIAGDGYVSLSWLNSSGAANYFIKRSLVFGGPYNAIATNGVSVTFTNTGLSNGTRYYFVVSAWNSAGESVDSIEAGALPVSQMPPLLGFGIAGGQIQFSWPLDHTGWLLQAQTNSTDAGLGTNWVTASGSNVTNQMSIPLDVGNASVFFRLISP